MFYLPNSTMQYKAKFVITYRRTTDDVVPDQRTRYKQCNRPIVGMTNKYKKGDAFSETQRSWYVPDEKVSLALYHYATIKVRFCPGQGGGDFVVDSRSQ